MNILSNIYTFHQRVEASGPGRGLVNFYLNKWEIAERVCYENKKVKSQDDLTIFPMVRQTNNNNKKPGQLIHTFYYGNRMFSPYHLDSTAITLKARVKIHQA